jgi:precorrin-6A synthase
MVDAIMKKLFVIGIGAGNPDYVTVQAINALNEVDVFFVIDKGKEKEDLVRLRKEVCDRFIENKSYRTVEVRWAQLSEQDLRFDRWRICRG